jgi:hypothetical protein
MKFLAFRRRGHLFIYCYRAEHERAAVRALARCPAVAAVEALALACYLGHDPKELGLT